MKSGNEWVRWVKRILNRMRRQAEDGGRNVWGAECVECIGRRVREVCEWGCRVVSGKVGSWEGLREMRLSVREWDVGLRIGESGGSRGWGRLCWVTRIRSVGVTGKGILGEGYRKVMC
jgi:hypothetical protein